MTTRDIPMTPFLARKLDKVAFALQKSRDEVIHDLLAGVITPARAARLAAPAICYAAGGDNTRRVAQ